MDEMEKNTCTCGCDHEHEHGEDCGCGHDHEHQYMTLQLEDESEVRCIVLGTFEIEEYEGKEYIALVSEDGEESFIYEYTEVDNEDGFELRNIESDEEFAAIVDAIDDILNIDDEDWDEEDEEFEDEE